MRDYFPGEVLPPHLSPFVTETEGEYVPPEKQRMLSGETGAGTLVWSLRVRVAKNLNNSLFFHILFFNKSSIANVK